MTEIPKFATLKVPKELLQGLKVWGLQPSQSAMESFEKIQKISVPDSDMQGWLGVLREGGLSEEEIDQMMVRLNETYRNIQGPVVVEREVEKIKEILAREHKYYINNEQEDQIRIILRGRIGVKPKEDDSKRISQ